MTQLAPMITSRAAASFVQIQISGVAQAATAAAIVDPATDDKGTDADGWIDCRAYKEIHASIKAVGADLIITAEAKTTDDADPISLLLGAGSVTAGTSGVILDATIRFGFIRFFAAGEAGEGNTVNLHVLLK